MKHHDNALPNVAAVTTETLQEMRCSSNLALSEVYLSGPFKEALRGKIFRADNAVTFFCTIMAGPATTNTF
jgi:hypothetical protein